MTRLSVEEALPLLAAALDDPYAPLTVADFAAELNESPTAALWTGERSAVFARICDYPRTAERVCECAPAGGDLDEIIGVGMSELEGWARANDCTQMFVQAGRDGWERVLKPYGYERVQVMLRKVL